VLITHSDGRVLTHEAIVTVPYQRLPQRKSILYHPSITNQLSLTSGSQINTIKLRRGRSLAKSRRSWRHARHALWDLVLASSEQPLTRYTPPVVYALLLRAIRNNEREGRTVCVRKVGTQPKL